MKTIAMEYNTNWNTTVRRVMENIAGEERRLTEFGAVVVELMAEKRGIRYATEMAALLERETGVRVAPTSLRKWLRGDHAAPARIARAIAAALELDDDEAEKLAVAYTFGKDLDARTGGKIV